MSSQELGALVTAAMELEAADTEWHRCYRDLPYISNPKTEEEAARHWRSEKARSAASERSHAATMAIVKWVRDAKACAVDTRDRAPVPVTDEDQT